MGSKGFSYLKPRLLLNRQTDLKCLSENTMIIKRTHFKRKPGMVICIETALFLGQIEVDILHHITLRRKKLSALSCKRVFFFQYSSSGWRHFSGHFPLVLQCNSFFSPPLPSNFSPATAVCGSLNCVLLPSRRQYHYHIFAVKGLQRMVLSWASVI